MGHARTSTVVVIGVEGYLVEVEAHISPGLPSMSIVGLADTAVGESRDRARSAILNSKLEWPKTRLTVGLSPAWLPKTGSGLDLAIAIAALAADGAVPRESVARCVYLGELGLDGRIRPVRGVLVAAVTAARVGLERIVVPAANLREASLVPGINVVGARTLAALVAHLRGQPEPDDSLADFELIGNSTASPLGEMQTPDLVDVRGHAMGRYVLEVTAAGGHHLAMLGPPGVGKTLLAERLPGILPALGHDEALEVTAVHSVAGRLSAEGVLVDRPPLCAPHHSATFAAMVGGGGGRTPRIGLISLAHRGVLFLDESPEFAPQVLDALRQPMESGEVTVARVGFTAKLPARFQLVLAANPCPCGLGGADPAVGVCTCSSMQRRRYLARLSGPLLDRVDLRLVLDRPSAADLLTELHPEASSVVAGRVLEARSRAAARLVDTPWHTNQEVPGAAFRRRYPPDSGGVRVLDSLAREPGCSARGLDRVARVAWTVADLAGRDRPSSADLMMAKSLRDSEGRWAA